MDRGEFKTPVGPEALFSIICQKVRDRYDSESFQDDDDARVTASPSRRYRQGRVSAVRWVGTGENRVKGMGESYMIGL